MMRRLLALMLCICMIGSITVYAVGNESEPNAELYDTLLAAESLDAFFASLDVMTQEELDAFFATLSSEQLAALEVKEADLEAAAAAAQEQPVEEEEVDDRTIAYETKSYTNAAPFLPPVEGETPALWNSRMLLAAAEEENESMGLSKTVSEPDADGVYTITLEAFATGAKTVTTVSKNIPTDIVLVLDQSMSMSNSFNTYRYTATTERSSATLYNQRNNLYVKRADDSYAPVTVARVQSEGTVMESHSNETNSTYFNNRDSLYHKCPDDAYGKITVNRTGYSSSRNYTYTCETCGNLGSSTRDNTIPNFTSDFYFAEIVYNYTFSYTALDGTTVSATVAAGASAPDWAFHTRAQAGSQTRMAALKNAVTIFAEDVTEKTYGEDGIDGTEDDVNHRIAVIGFSGGSNTNYQGSELFVGRTQYGYTSAPAHYGEAFQNMATAAGRNNITASIGAIAEERYTFANQGMVLANGVLDANPVEAGQQRNRVIVVFTDGVPGGNVSWDNNSNGVALAAIEEANKAKAKGVTVYTVGIFDGADPTTAGSWDNTNTDTGNKKANYYMQNMSSNNGVVRPVDSYYLAASDADALNAIFKSISQNIESGGSSITLDEEAIVRDIVSDQFALPEGADADDIKVYTADYTDEDTFANPVEFANAEIILSDDGKTVSVSNFNFSENWVGTETAADGSVTYRGKKLIIEVPVVERPGFLGGNNVLTNAGAGVYENDEAEEPIFNFETPTTNVPIKDITVEVINPGYNVYLLGSVTQAQMETDAIVKVGDVVLELEEDNYGLEAWQTEYVDISHTVSESVSNLTDDTTYTVSLTITPKEDPINEENAAVEKTGSADGKILVYKPQLTFADSDVYYGDTAPVDFAANLVSTKWFHGTTEAPASMGAAPALTVTATADASKIADGKIATKQDVEVNADVKLGSVNVMQYTTFAHKNCVGDCSWNVAAPDGTPAFLLHVKTAQLTVTKAGGKAGEPYVFTVYKDGAKYTELTIVGKGSATIYELPVGTYTVEEDTGWSWRYNSSVSGGVVLSSKLDEGTITCTNTLKNNQWLNGYTDVIANIFGVKH